MESHIKPVFLLALVGALLLPAFATATAPPNNTQQQENDVYIYSLVVNQSDIRMAEGWHNLLLDDGPSAFRNAAEPDSGHVGTLGDIDLQEHLHSDALLDNPEQPQH